MLATLGQPITATLVDVAGGITGLGARIEVPVTRAIASAFVAATKLGAVWTVTIDPPVAGGAYQFVWRTSDPEPPDFEAFIPLTVIAATISVADPATDEELTPTIDDLAALEHARTLSGGTEIGTFDATTNPTGDQVEALIASAVNDVKSRVGVTLTTAFAAEAKRLAALQAATLIEASFFPGELDSDRSAFRQYQAMYLSGIESLIELAREPSAMRLA
jgi:hypothetical protein